MIVYADTSALAKLLLQEEGSAEMRYAAVSCDALASAAIAYVELRAAMAAAIRQGRIPAPQRFVHVDALERLWDRISEVPLDRALLRNAGELAERIGLRGYDAVHLAALLQVGRPADVTFACWDTDLGRAAQELGYPILPG